MINIKVRLKYTKINILAMKLVKFRVNFQRKNIHIASLNLETRLTTQV
jgi:hypothetical protein